MYYQRYGGAYSESIGKGLKDSFRQGSVLSRLIYINCGLFLFLKLLHIVFLLWGADKGLYSVALEWLGVSADPEYILYRPWTPLTYMFTQFEFLHLLFNMLWLYWFGSFFLNYFTERQLMGIYLLGGLFGALLYVTAYNFFPYFDEMTRLSSWAIGASASVMAIVFAVCTYLPQHNIYIFLIGPVKLIYLALFTVLIDLLSIPSGNAGGHIAHLGGALLGWLFVCGIRRNRDISSGIGWIEKKIKHLFTPRKKIRVKYKKQFTDMNDMEYNEYKKRRDERINAILDKISKSGYESLTREEKEILFKSDRKN